MLWTLNIMVQNLNQRRKMSCSIWKESLIASMQETKTTESVFMVISDISVELPLPGSPKQERV